ncbi:ComF family protein [Bacillus spongiae]|uniref:ComF family protein n=1 Tax=Bacillus spongiae TaxID=2683610 RepID=A0ABU8HEA1_9BACI
MRCLYCDQKDTVPVTWTSLLRPVERKVLCDECADQFTLLTGPRCEGCSRMLEGLPQKTCADCQAWNQCVNGENSLSWNFSIFAYNEWMKQYFARYKYRGDYELSLYFRPFIKKILITMEYDILTPIPTSQQRLYERGFNQVEGLVDGLNYTDLLFKWPDEKQSKKSKQERMKKKNPFEFKNTFVVADKNIVLVDDLYTTGTTVRQAASILRAAGAGDIASLTLIRG